MITKERFENLITKLLQNNLTSLEKDELLDAFVKGYNELLYLKRLREAKQKRY